MYSHNLIVKYGKDEYIYKTSHDQCRTFHGTGTLRFNNQVVSDLKYNQSSKYAMLYAGTLRFREKCGAATVTSVDGNHLATV